MKLELHGDGQQTGRLEERVRWEASVELFPVLSDAVCLESALWIGRRGRACSGKGAGSWTWTWTWSEELSDQPESGETSTTRARVTRPSSVGAKQRLIAL